MVVKGTDPDGDPAEAVNITVTITVTSMDEPPVFPDGTLRTFKLEFNVQEDDTALYTSADPPDTPTPATEYTFTAADPEGAIPHLWSLEGADGDLEIDDNAVFSISNEADTRGQLSVAALDFEDQQDADKDNVYEITVVAADSKYDDAKKSSSTSRSRSGTSRKSRIKGR